MANTVTVRLPKKIQAAVKRLSRRDQVAVSDVVRESLRLYLSYREFQRIRSLGVPRAETRGFVTDEDVFQAVS